MPSAAPSRLTDDLWLAAHDGAGGRPTIGDRPLGVGLATGLLAELVHGGFLELLEGELFRTGAWLPDDPALRPVLAKMEAEERSWPPPQPGPSTQAWADARVRLPGTPARTRPGQYGWSPPVLGEGRQRSRGHELGTWMSYLAYEQRAEQRVIDRLTRAGLVTLEKRRWWPRSPTERYVPYDSTVAGNPGNTISTALQRGLMLSTSELVLAGLMLATGLHHHALATLTPAERSVLGQRLSGLDAMSRELLRAADAAVGEAAMR